MRFCLEAMKFHASKICAFKSSSLISLSSIPTQPAAPTYGGRKYTVGALRISVACSPGTAGSHTATRPSPWWLFANIVKTRFFTKNVGSPCDTFSVAPGIDMQMRRTRFRCCSLSRARCAFAILDQCPCRFPARKSGKARSSVNSNFESTQWRAILSQSGLCPFHERAQFSALGRLVCCRGRSNCRRPSPSSPQPRSNLRPRRPARNRCLDCSRITLRSLDFSRARPFGLD